MQRILRAIDPCGSSIAGFGGLACLIAGAGGPAGGRAVPIGGALVTTWRGARQLAGGRVDRPSTVAAVGPVVFRSGLSTFAACRSSSPRLAGFSGRVWPRGWPCSFVRTVAFGVPAGAVAG